MIVVGYHLDRIKTKGRQSPPRDRDPHTFLWVMLFLPCPTQMTKIRKIFLDYIGDIIEDLIGNFKGLLNIFFHKHKKIAIYKVHLLS